MFVEPDDIGSHSMRRATATYCYAGVHPGQPIVPGFLQAGWTIGRD